MKASETRAVIVALGVGLFVGCATKRTPIKPPPPPPPIAVSKSRLQLSVAQKQPQLAIDDTDFPGQVLDATVLLVKPKLKATISERDRFHAQLARKVKRLKYVQWEAVDLPKGQEVQIRRKYLESGLFERVQFQRVYKVDATPNDELLNQQWALTKMEAHAAWEKATSNDVIVAVIDTGIDFNHPDLVGNLWTGPQGEHGYTAVNGVISNGGFDTHYHGTHVAGTIGGVGNNGVGIVGINWKVQLAAFKFLDAAGSGTTLDAILCIEKMIDLKKAGHNIRVSNNSWGNLGDDIVLQEAFLAAEQAGILNICASGNNNVDTDQTQFIPSGFPLDGIVSVLASDQGDNKAVFSNYGSASTDLFAPGVGILSCKFTNGYWLLSGTSMACPHVAGAAAMVFGINPLLTPQHVKTLLLQPESYDRIDFALNSTRGGRLNLRKLVNNPSITNAPAANLPPIFVSATNQNFIAPGQTLPINVAATDPDGDVVSYNCSWSTYDLPWFFQSAMGGVTNFNGNVSTNTLFVLGKNIALDQYLKIHFSALDGRGGSSSTKTTAFAFRDASRVYDLEGAIRGFRFWDDGGQRKFRLDMHTNYPAIDSTRFTLQVSGGGGAMVFDPCCYAPNLDHLLNTNSSFNAGSYSVRVLVCDAYGNSADSPATKYFVGNSTIRPPTVRMTINTNRGIAPLMVVADMSATDAGDGTRLVYSVTPFNGSGWSADMLNPVRRFTLTEPGVYVFQLTAADLDKLIADTLVETFTVLPTWPSQITLARAGSRVELSWPIGVLQEATNANGPWTDSSNQDNPQTRPANEAAKFFRVR